MVHCQEIDHLIRTEMRLGHFTHAFAACGSLEKVEPCYIQSWSSEEPEAIIFDLASLTKALVTGPLVFSYLWQHGIKFDDELACWGDMRGLPAFILKRSASELLGHYSGLPSWWNFWITYLNQDSKSLDLTERLNRIQQVLGRICHKNPGTDLYSDVGYIALGYALESLSQGSDLHNLFKTWKIQINAQEFSEPIDFGSSLTVSHSHFVKTAYCPLRKRVLRGEVHDENCAALGGMAGHAGLFASGEALRKYLLALYQAPMGYRYLDLNHEKLLHSKHEGLLGLRRGSVTSALPFGSGGAMGHLGFTGTAFWIDWEQKIYGLFLTNRTVSGRLPGRISEVRSKIFGYLYEQLRS